MISGIRRSLSASLFVLITVMALAVVLISPAAAATPPGTSAVQGAGPAWGPVEVPQPAPSTSEPQEEYVADQLSDEEQPGSCDPDLPGCGTAEPSACDPDAADCQQNQPSAGDPGEASPESEDQDARQSWFLAQRAYPFATVPQGALARALRQATRLPIDTSRRVSANGAFGRNAPGAWQSIGPRPILIAPHVNNLYNGHPPVTGRVTSIATHPTNPKIAYIGTAFGGVWRTTNDGQSWTPVFDHVGSLSIGAVAIAPSNPQVIYVGTGEANSSADSYFGDGVWKSVNGGGTWHKVGGALFNGCGISRIAIDGANPNIVLVATSLGGANLQASFPCQTANVNPGLQRTSDGGAHWQTMLCCGTASDVVAARAPAGTMYAAFNGGYLFKSTNHGANWTQVTNGPPADPNAVGRTSLAVSGNGKVLYVAQASYPNFELLNHTFWKTTNGGGNWSQITSTADFCNVVGGSTGSCWYNLTMAVNPTNPGPLFAAGVYLNKCASTCSKVGAGPSGIHVDFHALTFDKSGRLWIGTDGGVYRTADNGAHFDNFNATLALTQFYPGVTGSPADVLMGGVQDNGSLRYTAATKWRMVAGGDGGFTAIDPHNPNIEYETYPFGWVYQSLNGGQTPFRTIDSFQNGQRNVCSLKPGDSCQFIFPMVMDPTNPHRLFVGSHYLWRGTGTPGAKATSPWTWKWSPLNASPFATAANAVAPAPNDANVIYVATAGYAPSNLKPQFLYSSDGGKHFKVRSGLPNRFISDIYVDPQNAAHIWVALSGFGPQHVYRSVDSGAHWINATGNLPNTPVGSIVVDTRFANPVLYVGTDAGVFHSTNNGGVWSVFGNGLPNSVVLDLVLDRAHNTLTAATHGRGAYVTGVPHP